MDENPYQAPEAELALWPSANDRIDIADMGLPQLALQFVMFAAALIVGLFAILWFMLALFQALEAILYESGELGAGSGGSVLVALTTFGFSAISTSVTLSMFWRARRMSRRSFRVIGDISREDVKAVLAVMDRNRAVKANRLLAMTMSGPDKIEVRLAGQWCRGLRLQKMNGTWGMMPGAAIFDDVCAVSGSTSAERPN